jgi:3-hydroxybutyryl-CoA dehydrogenase
MKVGILGAGSMGQGIAKAISASNIPVLLWNRRQPIEKMGKSPLVNYTTALEDLSGCSLVIEAIFEDFAEKQALFNRLEKIVSDSALVASNTSSISIGKLSKSFGNPSRFLGIHFMKPAERMKLVEVVSSSVTSDQTVKKAVEFVISLGKEPLVIKEGKKPGFYVVRMLMPMLKEALEIVQEQGDSLANQRQVDKAMKLGAAMPLGPFELMNFIGLPTVGAVMKEMYGEVPLILQNMINQSKEK